MKYLHTLICIAAVPTMSLAEEQLNEKKTETIVVIGKKIDIPESKLAGSSDLMTREEITYETVDDTLELFNKAPGVYLSRYNQGIINTDISIRGFAGDGSTPHGKLLIDGIPANLHNGYNELDQLFPLYISSISLFKGTSDPRYGIFNTAGNYNVTTRQDEAQQLQISAGSFNNLELQGYVGADSGYLRQNYSFGYRQNEGYREHTDLEKYALAGSWEWDIDGDQSFRIIARLASYDGDSPGYLSEEQAKDDPKQSADFANQDGGDKQTTHLSSHWSKNLSENTEVQLKAYYQSFQRERWVRFSESGSLQNRFDDQSQTGMIANVDWKLNRNWSLQGGLDVENQDVVEQRFGTIGQRRTRDEGNVIRDY